jgi:hypothetical protein
VIENAEPLYREIRIENKLGEDVGLKPGAQVDVIIEADAKETVKKNATKE